MSASACFFQLFIFLTIEYSLVMQFKQKNFCYLSNFVQMYKDVVPLMSKGLFCLYYGGPDILNHLDDRPASKTRWYLRIYIINVEINLKNTLCFSPIFLSFTLIYQISFMVLKYLKTRTIHSNNTNQG